jgi:cytochrome c biogenesis protein CcdA/thiol-disulfide isomerase/thioredoxin
MTLLVLAYLGGILTILSPCVLPVLPFVFARAGRPFATSILPMLVGMALTFALVATLAAVGGGWVVQANQYGRIAAMVLLAAFGLLLLWPSLADHVTKPLVAVGNRLSQSSGVDGERGSVLGSVLLGVAVGFLWAPCAGPILGLILTGAALQGANAHTSLLLLTYAAGAATSLALALLVGGRVFQLLKRSLGAGEWVRRGLGVAVLAAVVAIALGLDTGLLTRLSIGGTSRIEQALVEKAGGPGGGRPGGGAMTGGDAMTGGAMNGGAMTGGAMTGGAMTGGSAMTGGAMTGGAMTGGGAMSGAMTGGSAMSGGAMQSARGGAKPLPIEGELPALTGAVAWLNTPPLTPESLRGKVVLVDFWTYSCINCLRTLPYVRAWAAKYKDYGLVVLGVHTPEFAFEKSLDNVRRAVKDLGITYPVAVDNNYAVWGAFYNNYWPADYFVDAQGQIRAHAFGEGDYDKSEHLIQTLLTQAGVANVPTGLVAVNGKGIEAAADDQQIKSPETYVGYSRAQHFAATGVLVKDEANSYAVPSRLQLNQWGLGGVWTIEGEKAILDSVPGRIVFQFHARDLHLVLGPTADGKPVRFRVLLDGKAPGDNHGVDIDATGAGTVDSQRLYQLIRQTGPVQDRTFTIEFQDAGVQAFSFTFG